MRELGLNLVEIYFMFFSIIPAVKVAFFIPLNKKRCQDERQYVEILGKAFSLYLTIKGELLHYQLIGFPLKRELVLISFYSGKKFVINV